MKKRLSVLLCMALIAAFLLVGCGGSAEKYPDSKYLGTWAATTGEYMGMSISIPDLLGDCTLTFTSDGKCEYDLAGETGKTKWEEIDGGIKLDMDDELSMMEAADGSLQLDYEDVIMTFVQQ